MLTRFSAKAREKLILGHLPLVKHVLGRVAAHLPAHVDRSDLLEAGTLGLIDAADRFDPARNVRFHTYAMTRIRGAMLDALRSDDWLPRSVRSELVARRAGQRADRTGSPPLAHLRGNLQPHGPCRAGPRRTERRRRARVLLAR